jgi:HK97 gp10 family phage protein
MELKFEGLDELIREVDKIEGLTNRIKNKALIRGGDILVKHMKKEVYNHGLDRITGEAYESITRTDPRGGELFVGVEGGYQQPGFYLYFHEYGYYNVLVGRFIAPKPFASIAYEKSKWEIFDAYVDEFRKGLGMT